MECFAFMRNHKKRGNDLYPLLMTPTLASDLGIGLIAQSRRYEGANIEGCPYFLLEPELAKLQDIFFK